jgi:hypothetical protein
VTSVPRFEGKGAIRGRGACIELACLGHRAAGQLRAADARGEAEVVLDSSGRPGLAAERGALHDERVEPFGGAVDRGREPGRAGAHDQEVDLLARCELEPDPESAQHLAGLGPCSSPPAGQSPGAGRRPGCCLCTAAGSARATDHCSSRNRVGRRFRGRSPARLQRLAPDERGTPVAERAVLVQE